MGPGAALSGLPPLPPGASLVPSSGSPSALPPLPPGAALNGPSASAQPSQQPLTASPKPEGTYAMHAPDGRQVRIPYSQVPSVASQGYLFSDKGTLQQYARDEAADPTREDAVDRWISQQPWWNPVRMGRDLLSGAGGAALKTFTGLDAPAHGKFEQNLQLAADAPNTGAQDVGALGENIAEFFGGDELLGLVGKALPAAERLKQASALGKMLNENTMLAKLVKIGISAVKQGTIAGGQTYVKTGGDTKAAESAAGMTALGGAALEGVAAPLAKTAVGKLMPEAETPGEGAYAEEARAAAEPHLQNVARAMEGTRAASGGTDLVPMDTSEALAERLRGERPPALDVNAVLDQIHDFTGAADQLARVSDAGYDALDHITGGKFRQLNAEVAAAQKAAYTAEEGAPSAAAQKVYENKMAEMDALIDSTKGRVTPETVQALKANWRQSYMLRDFGDIWDKNLNGVPGSTKASMVRRGINGNGLMRGLQQAVRNFGRGTIERALGPGRLKNLENIARLNQTNAQRQSFNFGVHEVARYFPMYAGWRVGEHLGGVAGGIAGGAAGAAMLPTAEKVLNAVRANPKIGQYLTYAIEYGAKPEHYGPIVAEMIQRSETQKAQEGEQP